MPLDGDGHWFDVVFVAETTPAAWPLGYQATAPQPVLPEKALRLRRTWRIEDGVLKSTTRVDNPTGQPVEFVIQARGFFGAPELGFSSGQAEAEIESLLKRTLTRGFTDGIEIDARPRDDGCQRDHGDHH